MSKKYLVLELWPKNLKIGNFGPDFQMQISRERKEQTEIRLDFHNDQRQYFLNAPVKFRLSSLLHPENRGPKSGSQTGPNLHFWTIFQIFLPFMSYNYSGFLGHVKYL